LQLQTEETTGHAKRLVIAMSSASRSHGNAAEYGERIEEWAAEYYGLDLVDGTHIDARGEGGEPVQIKGCQRWVSNGPDERVRGRWRVWSGTLIYLLDEGMYLLVVYDDESEFSVEASRWVEPELLGEYCAGKWYGGHRPSKGDSAKLRWNELIPEVNDV